MSYIEEANEAEWATRRISIVGVARSFISQLSIGQDLTKVSLPAVFLYPYSALEFVSSRFLTQFPMLLSINKEADPVQRLLLVVKWWLSCTLKEKFDKKPYNPLLGEMHVCWNNTADYATTKCVAEQVSHHPPVSAIEILNEKEKVEMLCNMTFSIKFHGNSVSVKTEGSPVHIFAHQLQEQYISHLPNVSIKNVILGTKRIAWDGPCVLKCEKTNLQCSMVFKEEGWNSHNTVHATVSSITQPDVPIATISGRLGETLTITNPNTHVTQTFVDVPALPKVCPTQYPMPQERDERNSLSLWQEVSRGIVDDDMSKADAEKIQIENAQRKRRAENKNWDPRYFKFNPEAKLWEASQESIASICISWNKNNQPIINGEKITAAAAGAAAEAK